MSLDFITFLLIAIGISIIVGFTYYYARQRKELKKKDPLVYKIPNETNYNLNVMEDGDSLDDLTPDEAKKIIDKRIKSTDNGVLTRDDYAKLRKVIEKG